MRTHHLVAMGVVAAVVMAGRPSADSSPQAAPAAQTAPSARTPPAPAQAAAAPAGNAVNGRKLFVSFGCYQCHGYEAQGSSATGPRLGPRPIAYAAFLKYVRHPTNQMPPFTAKVVTDAELTDIHAFLRSLPQPPDADTIPLLK
jgi:cytochrome c5